MEEDLPLPCRPWERSAVSAAELSAAIQAATPRCRSSASPRGMKPSGGLARGMGPERLVALGPLRARRHLAPRGSQLDLRRFFSRRASARSMLRGWTESPKRSATRWLISSELTARPSLSYSSMNAITSSVSL